MTIALKNVKTIVDLAQYAVEREGGLIRTLAAEVKKRDFHAFTKEEQQELRKRWTDEGVKVPTANKRLSRARFLMKEAGVENVYTDPRGGKRAPQAPKGPDGVEEPTGKETADELDAKRKKKAKRAEQYINGTLEYIAFLPGTWATKSEEEQLVKLLKRVRGMAQADQKE